MKLWFCLILIVALAACTKMTSSTSKYALVVEAERGIWPSGHRVIYAVDEYGTLLNIDIPQEKELGYDFEWSSNGQWIAHSYPNPNPRSASDRDIYLINVPNDKTIRLTDNRKFLQRFAGAPAWSPDSTQIAFYANAPDAENNYGWGIYLMDVKCLLQDENCMPEPTFLVEGMNPDWSPNGKKIVYEGAYGSKNRGIFIVDLQNPGEIVSVDPCGGFPRWSPDGTKIVSFCKGAIQIVDANGENLIKYPIDGFLPKWSPDGKKIAFVGMETLDSRLGKPLDPEGNVLSSALFIMDTNGTNITRLTKSNTENINWFTWVTVDNVETR